MPLGFTIRRAGCLDRFGRSGFPIDVENLGEAGYSAVARESVGEASLIEMRSESVVPGIGAVRNNNKNVFLTAPEYSNLRFE